MEDTQNPRTKRILVDLDPEFVFMLSALKDILPRHLGCGRLKNRQIVEMGLSALWKIHRHDAKLPDLPRRPIKSPPVDLSKVVK